MRRGPWVRQHGREQAVGGGRGDCEIALGRVRAELLRAVRLRGGREGEGGCDGTTRPRNQIPAAAFLVQFVLRLCFFAFDFAVRLGIVGCGFAFYATYRCRNVDAVTEEARVCVGAEHWDSSLAYACAERHRSGLARVFTNRRLAGVDMPTYLRGRL